MNPNLSKFLKHYLAGLITSSWNGAIGAVAGILGIDGAAMTGVGDAHLLGYHEMGAAFVGAFVLHGIFWLKSHPLPEKFDTSAPFFPAATIPPPKIPPSSTPDLPTS